MSVVINGNTGITTPAVDTQGNLAYTGTLTGGTGVVNLGSGQFYKDASGNVGIGTSSPVFPLHIAGTSTNFVGQQIQNGTASRFDFYSFGSASGLGADYNNRSAIYQWVGGGITMTSLAGDLRFGTNNTERMRITSAGNVGIGTSSPAEGLAQFNVTNAGAGDISAIALNLTNDSTAAGTGVSLRFSPGNVRTALRGSYINSVISGANGSDLQFWTCINGFAPAERMRIDSSGNLLVGTTSSGGVGFTVATDGAGRAVISNTTFGGGFTHNSFRYNGTQVGSITTSTNSTTYSTSSDYRLKHDIQPMQNALATVALLKPVTYKWNADDSESQGFIAHELQEVVPECVTGEKDAVDADGKPVYQGIDTSFLVATLTAALQELHQIVQAQAAELDTVKAELATLKGAQA